jgi:hypothetical protein
MPTVKISEEAEEVLQQKQKEIKEEHGVSGTKKELVEEAILEKYE